MNDEQVLWLRPVAGLNLYQTIFSKFESVFHQIHQNLFEAPAIAEKLWYYNLLVILLAEGSMAALRYGFDDDVFRRALSKVDLHLLGPP